MKLPLVAASTRPQCALFSFGASWEWVDGATLFLLLTHRPVTMLRFLTDASITKRLLYPLG
jgi:hypothetical protein